MRKRDFKKVLEYPVIFSPAEEGGFNVSFPDFPGCVTFGRNFEEAREKAKEVLGLWLEELRAGHQFIPLKTRRPIIDAIEVVLTR